MKPTLLLCLMSIVTVLGCAQVPTTGTQSVDANTAECHRRMQAEGQDISKPKGASRLQYCLETIQQEAAMPRLDADVAASMKAFGACKAEAATRNLSLDAHQTAISDCARRHGGVRGQSCISQLLLQKVRLSALETELAFCMQNAPKQ